MQMGNEQKGMSKGNDPVPGNTGGGSSQGGSVDQVTKSFKAPLWLQQKMLHHQKLVVISVHQSPLNFRMQWKNTLRL